MSLESYWRSLGRSSAHVTPPRPKEVTVYTSLVGPVLGVYGECLLPIFDGPELELKLVQRLSSQFALLNLCNV